MKKQISTFKSIHYIQLLPENFNCTEKSPVIFFLHGAGSRGDDIRVLEDNLFFSLTSGHNLPAIIYAPQCYKDSWFDIFEELQSFILEMLKSPVVDTKRVYLIGASMGGYATWQMSMTLPEVFAAIIPICGGGMYCFAEKLKNTEVWAYHGSKDEIVFPEESVKMVDAVNKAGGSAQLTICEGVGHSSWINAYEDHNLFDWLLLQKRKAGLDYDNLLKNPQLFG